MLIETRRVENEKVSLAFASRNGGSENSLRLNSLTLREEVLGMSVGTENESSGDDLSLRSLDRPGLGFRLLAERGRGGRRRGGGLFEGGDGSPGVNGELRGCRSESESGESGTEFVAEESKPVRGDGKVSLYELEKERKRWNVRVNTSSGSKMTRSDPLMSRDLYKAVESDSVEVRNVTRESESSP